MLAAGVIKALRPDDYVCSTYRDHVHALSKGVPAREVGGAAPLAVPECSLQATGAGCWLCVLCNTHHVFITEAEVVNRVGNH